MPVGRLTAGFCTNEIRRSPVKANVHMAMYGETGEVLGRGLAIQLQVPARVDRRLLNQ